MSCGIEGLVLALKLQTDILAEMVPTLWAIDGVSSIQSYYRKRELLWELQGVTRMCERPVVARPEPRKEPIASMPGCYAYGDHGIIMCELGTEAK